MLANRGHISMNSNDILLHSNKYGLNDFVSKRPQISLDTCLKHILAAILT